MNIGASGGGSGKYWCAFGVAQQQWGYCSSRTATFPIPFPASALFIVAVPKTTSTSATATGAEYLGTTSVNLYLHELRVGISQAAIEQWGFTVFDPVDYKNVNFTLPLSVNGTFCAFSTGYDPKGSTFLWHSMSHFNNVNVGVTGFVFDSRYTFTGLGYLAVCWQKQWGKILGDTVNLKIINFPVSFNECFGGLALFNGDPVAAAECATITDITNTNFKIYMYANNAGTGYANANIFYLFLGAQPQWGMNIHGWVIFPIPFTKFRRLVTNHQGNVFMDSKARESNTLSGFTLDVADNSDQNKDAQWIAIGA